MSTTDRMLLDDSLDEYRFYTKKIAQISKEIEAYILNHFPEEYDLLMIIPGMKAIGAAVILGEIGPDVDAFASAAKLASWAGLAPESYESAGKNRSGRTTRGNKYIKSILVMAGGLAGRSKYPVFYLFTIEYPIKDPR